jgi:hypothetical protein
MALTDEHKVLIHTKAHHHPHKWRDLELSRLLNVENIKPQHKPAVQAELKRWEKERKLIKKHGMDAECEALLRAHIEDTEYRSLYSAAQLMLCNPYGIRCLSQRFKGHFDSIANIDFSRISPWLAKLHSYLSKRPAVYDAEVERVDAMQNIGRTNEHASLLAECINAVIRAYDDAFASLTRVSRWEPRLDEILAALRIGLTKLELVETQNIIYGASETSAKTRSKLNNLIGELHQQDRYAPLYMMDREVNPKAATADLKLDSDFNTKNIATLKELIKAFETEKSDIAGAKKTTQADVVEGAIGAAVNDYINAMEWEDTDGLPTKSNELTRPAVRQVLAFRELDRAVQAGCLHGGNKTVEQRTQESWAIVLSHAVMASDLAFALRLKSAATTYEGVRTLKPLRDRMAD